MNVLVYPMLSVDEINADSNYIIISNLIKSLYKEHNFVLILNPKKKYVKDDLYKYCKIVYLNMPESKRNQVLYFNAEAIRKICTEYGITHIFNNVVEQGHNFKFLNNQIDPSYHYKVLNYHHYNIHPSFGESIYKTMLNVLYQQIIGSYLVDLNYFHSNHSFNMYKEEAEKILKKIPENYHVELGKHGKTIEQAEKYSTYTFIYNHRLAGYKNYTKTIEMFNELYKVNKDFKVIFTCADTANESKIKKLPYANVVRISDHQKYVEILSKCHANVTNSAHETYCISLVESMQNNQLIIAPNSVTFPELLGKDYKYLFNNDKEQLSMMIDAVNNKITNIEHQNLDDALQADIYRKLFKKLEYKKRPLERSKHKDKLQDMFSNISSVNVSKATNMLGKQLNLATQSFPPNKVALLLEDLGYKYDIKTNTFNKNT